jgi:hypothetical protein
MRPGNS